jgi:hypothetical protein
MMTGKGHIITIFGEQTGSEKPYHVSNELIVC